VIRVMPDGMLNGSTCRFAMGNLSGNVIWVCDRVRLGRRYFLKQKIGPDTPFNHCVFCRAGPDKAQKLINCLKNSQFYVFITGADLFSFMR
jgi:hypothetical protein